MAACRYGTKSMGLCLNGKHPYPSAFGRVHPPSEGRRYLLFQAPPYGPKHTMSTVPSYYRAAVFPAIIDALCPLSSPPKSADSLSRVA